MRVAQEWAVAQARVRNYRAARELFIKALALNPRHVPALAAWAEAERCAGQVQAARNLFARAVQARTHASCSGTPSGKGTSGTGTAACMRNMRHVPFIQEVESILGIFSMKIRPCMPADRPRERANAVRGRHAGAQSGTSQGRARAPQSRPGAAARQRCRPAGAPAGVRHCRTS